MLVAPVTVVADPGHRSQKVLLALGDSISFGFQAPKMTIPPDPGDFGTGYVDVLSARDPSLQVTNFSCPGETTTTLINGGCIWTEAGFALHDAYQGSQLEAAVAFLRDHRRDSVTVTLSVWSNDIRELAEACGGDLGCISERAPAEIAAFSARLGQILDALRKAGPSARITVLLGTHTFPPPSPEIDAVYAALNAAIVDTARASRVTIADPRVVLNPSGDAERHAAICTYTLVCVTGGADNHPSDAGYVVIANAFSAAFGPWHAA